VKITILFKIVINAFLVFTLKMIFVFKFPPKFKTAKNTKKMIRPFVYCVKMKLFYLITKESVPKSLLLIQTVFKKVLLLVFSAQKITFIIITFI